MKNIEELFEESYNEHAKDYSKQLRELDREGDWIMKLWFKRGYETAKREYEEKLKRAVEVIKFYAEPGHWGIDSPGMKTAIDPCDQAIAENEHSSWGIRGGKRARKYFKKWSEG